MVESGGTYGMHFYAVKDKSGVPWSLAVSARGIFQFEAGQPPRKPRRVQPLSCPSNSLSGFAHQTRIQIDGLVTRICSAGLPPFTPPN